MIELRDCCWLSVRNIRHEIDYGEDPEDSAAEPDEAELTRLRAELLGKQREEADAGCVPCGVRDWTPTAVCVFCMSRRLVVDVGRRALQRAARGWQSRYPELVLAEPLSSLWSTMVESMVIGADVSVFTLGEYGAKTPLVEQVRVCFQRLRFGHEHVCVDGSCWTVSRECSARHGTAWRWY